MSDSDIDFGFSITGAGTDMEGHMETLRALSRQYSSVAEFGVHDCTSTWALLAGHPATLTSYDIGSTDDPFPGVVGANSDRLREVYRAASGSSTVFNFVRGDTSQVDIGKVEFLFIDSHHSYDHLRKELELNEAKVTRCIALHDTTTFGHADQDDVPTKPGPHGLWPAIEEFLAKYPHWVVKERFIHSHGLTVLERVHA